MKVLLAYRGEVHPLTGTSLCLVLLEKYRMQIETLEGKLARAKKPEKRMRYRQEIRTLNEKLNTL